MEKATQNLIKEIKQKGIIKNMKKDSKTNE